MEQLGWLSIFFDRPSRWDSRKCGFKSVYHRYFLREASAAPKPPQPAPEKHTKIALVTVRPGDTLWGLARRYHTTVADLLRLNRLQNPNLIYAGEIIRVRVPLREEPGVTITTYTVRRGDTLTSIARQFGTTVTSIVAINDLKIQT